jgi:hypothetical protein
MSETYSLVRVKRTNYICDCCGKGVMTYTRSWRQIANTGIIMYYHYCDVCDAHFALPTTYPHTEELHESNQ